MNKGTVTKGIVLTRTNFGEADRILTVLTPDQGKIRVIAKGVRKSTSKLAGGIELFSISNVTFIKGRGDVDTLISTRLIKHFNAIAKDLDRTQFGYELLKVINRMTEDSAEPAYFDLLEHVFAGLNETNLSLDRIKLWFDMQLLKLTGHSPNLKTDTSNKRLTQDKAYTFSFDDMAFEPSRQGRYNASHIKILRLGISLDTPQKLAQIQGSTKILPAAQELAHAMLRYHIRI